MSKTAGFNIRDLCPIAHAHRTFIPALFVAGRNDDFIRPHHSQQIHDLYAGDKNIVLVEGDHNSPRPSFLYDSVFIFLQTYLQVPMEWGLERENIPIAYPPWYGTASASAFAARYAAHGGVVSARGEEDFPEYVDWDGDVEALQAAALAGDEVGVDGAVGLGMTGARQAEFQDALFHMLAQVSVPLYIRAVRGCGSGCPGWVMAFCRIVSSTVLCGPDRCSVIVGAKVSGSRRPGEQVSGV